MDYKETVMDMDYKELFEKNADYHRIANPKLPTTQDHTNMREHILGYRQGSCVRTLWKSPLNDENVNPDANKYEVDEDWKNSIWEYHVDELTGDFMTEDGFRTIISSSNYGLRKTGLWVKNR